MQWLQTRLRFFFAFSQPFSPFYDRFYPSFLPQLPFLCSSLMSGSSIISERIKIVPYMRSNWHSRLLPMARWCYCSFSELQSTFWDYAGTFLIVFSFSERCLPDVCRYLIFFPVIIQSSLANDIYSIICRLLYRLISKNCQFCNS